jgi:HK97 family phage major capsid protein
MAPKLKVPSGPDGLQEVLGDHARLKEYFSAESVADGSTKGFLDEYAAVYAKKNPDTVDDMRTQVQSVLFDLVRDSGGGKRPNLDLGSALGFENGYGRPALSAAGTAAIGKGKGAVYNRYSPGAQFEAKFRAEDRFSSIGEYCQAIKEERSPSSSKDRKDLLQKLENVRAFQNSFGSEDPAAGGFLIPEIMRSDLMQLALEKSITRSRATVIPMSTLRTTIPTVDDTSHTTSLFGGVVFYWTEESGELQESTAKFGRVALDAKKLTGFFRVPNELLSDAPAFSGWFDSRVPAGLAWSEDVSFMTGTGAGEPEGFLDGPATVTVAPTDNALAWADIASMYSRMLPTSLDSAVWIASIDLFPALATLTLSTPGIWMGGYNATPASGAPPVTIMGRPVIFTEKVPNYTGTEGTGTAANAGSLNFVDLSYYLIGDRQSVAVAASDQAFFQQDQMAYRLIERVDGRPWLQQSLQPHNSGPNLSAFVSLGAGS